MLTDLFDAKNPFEDQATAMDIQLINLPLSARMLRGCHAGRYQSLEQVFQTFCAFFPIGGTNF